MLLLSILGGAGPQPRGSEGFPLEEYVGLVVHIVLYMPFDLDMAATSLVSISLC